MTITIAGNLGISPFDIFNQDTDTVIMLMNYYLRLGEENKGQTPPAMLSDREESAAFWAAL